jgi:autotransporter-associated beta strand protein
MKLRHHLFASAITAISLASSAHAADYTWDGGNGNWNATNWNGGTASGPTTAGNTATINSGNVTANIGGPGNVDSITLGSGSQLNLYNGDSGIYAYGYFPNLVLQGGTVNGGSGTYSAYGASVLGNVTVSGSAASTITGASWFNINPTTTFTVADATGNTNTDLLVSTSLRGPVGSPDWVYNTAKLIKEGAGTMEVTVHSYFRGGLDLNAGTLKVSGGNGGYGFFDGTVNVNSGTTLAITSDGTGFGYQSGWKPATVNINGGTVTGGGHIWGISGGVNMTGGTLDSSGGFQWNYTNLNTNASADTATVSGPLNLRGDGGYNTLAVSVADGAAATDLIISGNITQQFGTMGITKSGAGTMVLSGANNYTGTTTVNEGVLSLSSATLDDISTVIIAADGKMNLNFSGNDVIGNLEIAGSGLLPAGLYNSSHPTYGSYFTGTGSLQILGASGSWISLVDGTWSTDTNWAGNTIASGYDATATFSAATGVTVTVDTSRKIGNMIFAVSDYTLTGPGDLNLDAGVTPLISVATGRTASIGNPLSGTYGLEKTGDGKLVFTGVKTYTGGTTVSAGTLELSGGMGGNSQIRGALNLEAGTTCLFTNGDGTGFGWTNPVTSVSVDAATLNAESGGHIGFGGNASVSLDNGGSILGSWQWNGDGLLGFSSYGDLTNTISGALTLRSDAGVNHTFNVNDGAAATDLQVNANLSDQYPFPSAPWIPASDLIKSGAGTMVLNGTNTYDGNTVINDGVLSITATSSLHFRPTTNGITNSVSGTATGTLSFLGTVDLDLSAADATGGNVWNLFNFPSFTGVAPTMNATAVTSTLGNFTEVSGGVWEFAVTNEKWVFTESNGNLAYVVTATDYDNWEVANGVTGASGDDDDSDGLTNFEEYAFGLDPTGGSSVNAIAVQLDKTAGTFSYTRRQQSLTGLTYTVWYSTDLTSWNQDSGAIQGTATLNGEVETVPVTVSSSLLTNGKLFLQVRGQ